MILAEAILTALFILAALWVLPTVAVLFGTGCIRAVGGLIMLLFEMLGAFAVGGAFAIVGMLMFALAFALAAVGIHCTETPCWEWMGFVIWWSMLAGCVALLIKQRGKNPWVTPIGKKLEEWERLAKED